jgi:hypothetical protein
MRTTTRRVAALVAVPALALGVVSGFGPAAQAAQLPAVTGADPAPAASAAAYLAAQPGANGLITTYFEGTGYPDAGLTVDAALALHAVGGQAAKVATMAAAVEADTYPAGSAGAAAKFTTMEYELGRTSAALPTAVSKVNSSISGGRLTDPDDPATTYDDDFNSPLTQSFAVNALHDAGAANAGAALTYLLSQQCAAGFVAASFPAKAATDQSCDAATTKTPSIDNTALTVINLQDQKATPAVATAITKALDWLVSQQAANGSFASGNANSTGLAGWALGVGGRADKAATAASWLRGQQLANAGSCVKYAAKDNGAITLDTLGLTNAAAGPLSNDANSVATRATAQALPALLWASGGATAGDTKLVGTEFAKAGTTQVVEVTGAPGNTLCVTNAGTASRVVLPASGKLNVPVVLPATTADVTVSTVDAGGETDTVTISGLAKAKLKVKSPKRVERGDKFRVKVKGLADGESVILKYRGKKVVKTANAKGVVKVKLKARKLGTSKVKVRGEFGFRKGAVKVTVTR